MNDIKGNGLVPIIAQALEVMEAKAGHNIPLDKVNLAELGRLTGLSRSKLRTLKKNGFQNGIKSKLPCVKRKGKLDAFKEVINTYLKQGVTNSAVIFSELKKEGFTGGLTIVKNYIKNQQYSNMII